MNPSYPALDVLDTLSVAEFRSRYLGRCPVMLRSALASCPAVTRWDLDYLRRDG